MSYRETIADLREARMLLTALVESLDDTSCRTQYHPDLSPPGWHLGHCTWTECLWLQQTVLGDDRYTEPVRSLYTPTETPRPERGKRLPAQVALLQWSEAMQAHNDEILEAQPAALMDHPLMRDDYLLHFLVQHYCQHYETLLMVLTQRAIAADSGDFDGAGPMEATQPAPRHLEIVPGHYRVGGQPPSACDNELPPQQVTIGPYSIAAAPVTNSEYLAFMQDDGYRREDCWTDVGLEWRRASACTHPDHWRQDRAGNWYGIAARSAYALAGTDPVAGVCYYEAEAFARWCGARLPHEYQWEVACRLQLLEQTGRAWEWCENTFHAYEGFSPFPYDDYSLPWFDGQHYSLRGGSLHTRPPVKRASFRNFYTPDKRHVFAGLRLVFDAQ